MVHTTAQVHLHCSASATPKAVQYCTIITNPKMSLSLSCAAWWFTSQICFQSCIAFVLQEEKKEEKAAPKEEKPEPKEEKAPPPPKEEKPQPPKQEPKPSKPAPSKVQLLPQLTALVSSSSDHQVVPYMQQNMELNEIATSEHVYRKQYSTLKRCIRSCAPQSITCQVPADASTQT